MKLRKLRVKIYYQETLQKRNETNLDLLHVEELLQTPILVLILVHCQCQTFHLYKYENLEKI